jgi:hypothetical protein
MIIKVPIYLEVDSIPGELVPSMVETLHKKFTSILRKEKLDHFIVSKSEPGGPFSTQFKIITREKALDFLRTNK